MKVLVTGSRDWPYAERDVIKVALLKAGATIVIHGDCRGADTQAAVIAKELGLTVRPYPAQWKLFGKAAGAVRNQQMLDEEHRPEEPIDLVLAFPMPTSVGTHDMIARAKAAGIPVIPHTSRSVGPEHGRAEH